MSAKAEDLFNEAYELEASGEYAQAAKLYRKSAHHASSQKVFEFALLAAEDCEEMAYPMIKTHDGIAWGYDPALLRFGDLSSPYHADPALTPERSATT